MERDDNNMHRPGADRTGSNRFTEADQQSDTKPVREANKNIRKAEGEDSTEPRERSGNRPRFDRDR